MRPSGSRTAGNTTVTARDGAVIAEVRSEPENNTAGLLHCVCKDGTRRFFQDTGYRMANPALCLYSCISSFFFINSYISIPRITSLPSPQGADARDRNPRSPLLWRGAGGEVPRNEGAVNARTTPRHDKTTNLSLFSFPVICAGSGVPEHEE
jgi:hypothetical protein